MQIGEKKLLIEKVHLLNVWYSMFEVLLIHCMNCNAHFNEYSF